MDVCSLLEVDSQPRSSLLYKINAIKSAAVKLQNSNPTIKVGFLAFITQTVLVLEALIDIGK